MPMRLPSTLRLLIALMLFVATTSPLSAKTGESALESFTMAQWMVGFVALFIVNAAIVYFLTKGARKDDKDREP